MLASSNAFLLPFTALSAKEEIDEKPRTASAAPPEIPDLPDELLLMIFKHAKGGTDIRNVRLSCRRFRDASSLHPTVTVRELYTEETKWELLADLNT